MTINDYGDMVIVGKSKDEFPLKSYKIMVMFFYSIRLKRLYLFISILMLSVVWCKPAFCTDNSLPFSPGEKITFELRWFRIKAGEATLEMLPVEELNGEKVYHFVMTAKSTQFIDGIYKVRDRIDSYTDTALKHSVYYKKKQREGSYKKDVVVKFDWENKTSHYTSIKKKGKKNEKTLSLPEGTFDPLSIFYYIRTLDLKKKNVLEHHVTDGKKVALGRAVIVRKETIRINKKKYETYLIEPDLKDIGGVFKKSKNAKLKIWVTADDRKIPVKIKSKVSVGSFVGEVKSIKGSQ